MSKEYAGDKIILVMDGAGWHKAKNLQVPDNIEIILLPPYSPELNPVERLWQHIKQNTIKNKVYKTLNSLKDVVAKFLNQITPREITTICRVNYMSN
jgi:transposase